ncbi:hypothetical protein AMK59_2831 [Oryctes borbonicus]|uniref:Uncharacterized protein n=1 Tax=Oryctes borbonicus TaxID=1629725 RepID=A0A0T6BHD9_9SCAR|nr:hypothetical protein AMK59_2831 [Oryctes borbonicus]
MMKKEKPMMSVQAIIQGAQHWGRGLPGLGPSAMPLVVWLLEEMTPLYRYKSFAGIVRQTLYKRGANVEPNNLAPAKCRKLCFSVNCFSLAAKYCAYGNCSKGCQI